MKCVGTIKYLIFTIFCFMIFSFNVNAASISVKASSSSITKGGTVTFTVTISSSTPLASMEGRLTCSGAGVNGGVNLEHNDGSNSLYSKNFTYTAKPTSTGTVTCSTSGVKVLDMNSDPLKPEEAWMNLNNTSATVKVNEPAVIPPKEYSSNNNLESLSIEGFELDKEFDEDTLEYNVELPNETETITIKATPADDNATVKGDGNIKVSEGSNKIEIKVTAENGNVKTYVINATVKELDPIEITIDDKKYTIIRKEDVLEAPEGFEKTTIKIGDDDVLAYKNDTLGYTLVGLKDEDGNSKYYIYDDGKYLEFNILTARGLSVIVLDYPKDKVFDNYILGEFEVNDIKYKGYKSTKNFKFYLIYAKSMEDGKEYLYQYDTSEGTLQKYNEDILDLVDKYKEEKDKYKLYLIIVASVFGVAVVATITTLIIKNKKGRKKTKVKSNQINSDINF